MWMDGNDLHSCNNSKRSERVREPDTCVCSRLSLSLSLPVDSASKFLMVGTHISTPTGRPPLTAAR